VRLEVGNYRDGTYSLELHPAILDDSTSSRLNGEARLYLSVGGAATSLAARLR
jgi:hypothetical protein